MAQKRGRTSLDQLLIVKNGLAATVPRPDAPYDLADDEVEVWRAVVESMPADHFIPANYHLLSQLCQHVVEARRVAQLIKTYRKQNTRSFNYREYGELLRMRTAESLIIARLSRSMRLSQQATRTKSMRLPGRTIDTKMDVQW